MYRDPHTGRFCTLDDAIFNTFGLYGADLSPLVEHVAQWALDGAPDYDGDATGPLRDLAYGGCQSGMVGHLIYYRDTTAFYAEHALEIDALVTDLCNDTGCTPIALFNGWDAADPFARETTNQNLLAWVGFELVGSRLLDLAA
jgi:hypothetical protein